jgi:hypothetical protein
MAHAPEVASGQAIGKPVLMENQKLAEVDARAGSRQGRPLDCGGLGVPRNEPTEVIEMSSKSGT